jgi:hypothetical protein
MVKFPFENLWVPILILEFYVVVALPGRFAFLQPGCCYLSSIVEPILRRLKRKLNYHFAVKFTGAFYNRCGGHIPSMEMICEARSGPFGGLGVLV